MPLSFLTLGRLASSVLLSVLPCCALHTYDEETGTAHLWGFGHLSLHVQHAPDDAELQAVTVGTSSVGANLDCTRFSPGAGIGYHSSRVTYVVASNTQMRLEEPYTRKLRIWRNPFPSKPEP
jgi:hypothetical protein